MLLKMKSEYEGVITEGARVIFLDETVFSVNTMLLKSWSSKNHSINIADMRSKFKTQAVIAGISVDHGLDCYLIYDRSIKKEEFKEFLLKIRDLYPEERIYLFMDNLVVHKSSYVREVYKELNLTPIFNVPYSPQYNGIESYWFLLKQHYKKIILKLMITCTKFDPKTIIKRAIGLVESEKVLNCAKDGLN